MSYLRHYAARTAYSRRIQYRVLRSTLWSLGLLFAAAVVMKAIGV